MDKPTAGFQVWWDHSEKRLTLDSKSNKRTETIFWNWCVYISELGMFLSSMPFKIVFAITRIFTKFTVKRFFSCMCKYVNSDMSWGHHNFGTEWTRPRSIGNSDWIILKIEWFSMKTKSNFSVRIYIGVYSKNVSIWHGSTSENYDLKWNHTNCMQMVFLQCGS